MRDARSNQVKFDAELTISRLSGGSTERPMRIRIADAASSTQVLEAEFSLEGFMKALTSQSDIDGKATLWMGPIGCKQETKTEQIRRPKKHDDAAEVEALLKPFEVDGWRGDRSDAHNHHRWVGENKVSVLFRRYVNAEGEVWSSSR